MLGVTVLQAGRGLQAGRCLPAGLEIGPNGQLNDALE